LKLSDVTQSSVVAFFDREADQGRPLLPDLRTVSGLGSYLKYERAATLMADSSVRRALDVGCNRGSIEALFRERFPARSSVTSIDGIDVSPNAIRAACELGLPNCHFEVYSGSRFPYPASTFDVVVLVEVLEHVPAKEELLREIWRVLKPDGRLFLTTPNPECWALKTELQLWRMLRLLFRRPPVLKDEFISHGELVRLINTIGFIPTEQGPMYEWPRLYLYFLGWSVLPPLPPRVLYRYQKLCVRLFDSRRVPLWLSRRMKWTLATTLTKSADA
jgi:SAM-dependent methyltransferase